MRRIGDDAHLTSGEAHRVTSNIVQRHTQQRHRNPLACGQQHVHLSALRVARHLACELDQIVGCFTHGGDHCDDINSLRTGFSDMPCHVAHPIGIGHRCATVFLYDQRHRFLTLSLRE